MTIQTNAHTGVFCFCFSLSCLFSDENCAPGYHYFDSTCYKLHDIPKTKPAASAACINEGAELVTVMSQVQENYLAHMIGSTAKGRNGAWIKLNDERMENEYR